MRGEGALKFFRCFWDLGLFSFRVSVFIIQIKILILRYSYTQNTFGSSKLI